MPSALWLLAAGAFLGAALTSRLDGVGLMYAVAALICGLAYFAVDRSQQALRQDIADEMKQYEPPGQTRPSQGRTASKESG